MAEFVKIGNNILPKPKGADYDLINGQVYDLTWDDWNERVLFSENGDLNLPTKVYQLKEDEVFKNRVINYFNNNIDKDAGVMLAGTKGTGKTMMAKIIAKESNLPIIVVNPKFPTRKLVDFFKSFNTPVCILFDEVEKNFDTEKMLEFLDGVQKTAKKLVLMTCNDINRVSEYFIDRCSRIRYIRKYKAEDNLQFLDLIAKDMGFTKIEEIKKYCENHIELPSIDNLYAFLNELKDIGEDSDFDEAIKYLNITKK